MQRRLAASFALCLCVAFASLADGAPARKRAIVLGFDGVDAGLCETYLSQGQLPHLQKLREQGTFLPLGTTNPAQSPVAWAALTTGSNPGKTNIYDFLESKRLPGAPPYPDIALVTPSTQHAFDNPNVRRLLLGRALAAVIGALALGLLLKVFRVRWLYAAGIPFVLLAAVLAVGWVLVNRYLPAEVPMAVNQRHGVPFWSVVAKQGLRATVLEAPVSFPPDSEDGLRMLSGLGVPDVAKTWGFWSFFTSDPKAKLTTETGGWIYPLRPKNDAATVFVHGPEDIFTKDRVAKLVEQSRTAKTRKEQMPVDRELDGVLASWFDGMIDMVRKCDLAEEFESETVQELERGRARIGIMGSGESVRAAEFPQLYEPMQFRVDRAAKSLVTTVHGRDVVSSLGTWSDWVTIDYRMNPMLHVTGMAKVYLQQIEPNLEIVMTPIQFHPADVPPIVDLTHPHDLAAELCEESGGPFETLGWATMTNPAKDDRLDDDGFLAQTWGVYHSVERVSLAELDKRDWDLFFTMFAVTDRMQHIMYRMIDPKNPMYKAELAAKYGNEILKMYKGMDEFVGKVAEKYVDDDTLLLVVSDHGFKSFRRGVNLNTWLKQEGLLYGGSNKEQTVTILTTHSAGFDSVVWDKTKAYALGLGGIYINKKGREGLGIVEPKDYDAVCDEIVTKLRTLKDSDGTAIVRDVYKTKEIYHGDQMGRAPDLIVGFNEGYRVSWQTTLGAVPDQVVENNDQRWSGDHCSVDPSLVPGILFSNRKLETESANLLDVAPTICAHLGISPDPSWDGRSLVGVRTASR
jgi:predicted AlkP superfamily phosphohydrolase/phosphomutase